MIYPMQVRVNHKGYFHIHDILNCSLCYFILMLCYNSREKIILMFVVTVQTESIKRKNNVVAMHVRYINTRFLPEPLL